MNIREVLQELDSCYEKGDRKATESFLRTHIARCRQEGDWQSQLTLNNELIGLYRVLGRFDDAEEVFLGSLRLLQDNDMEGTIPYASTLLNGANLYRAAGRTAQAEAIFHQVYGIYRVILDPKDFRFAGFYNNLGLVQREQRKWTEALESLGKGLAILECLTDTEFERATSHANIADIQIVLSNYSEAEKELQRAEELYDQMLNKGPHYASFLNTRGVLAKQQGDWAKAADCFRMGMEWVEKFYGRNQSYRTMEQNLLLVKKQLEEMT